MLRSPREGRNKIPFIFSLQMKYAMSYLAILAVVLVLLNTYPVTATQTLLFRAERESLQDQATVLSSALMELESLTEERVSRVMEMLDNSELDRVLVTDAAGLILYDSDVARELAEDDPVAEATQYALRQEVVLALQGHDITYSRYGDGAFVSSVIVPVTYRGMIIGSVYLYDVDQDQGALLVSFQENLRNISMIVAAIAVIMGAFFSKMLTNRISALLSAIRIVGEGEYGHRLDPVGRDELAHMAREFNQLTDRLQTTEEVRRRFVSDASHELKTPLASICLLSDSILQNDSIDRGTVREFVGDIGQEAQRLTRITEHLLALSRLDSVPAQEQYAVDVGGIVSRVMGILTPVADEGEVELINVVRTGLLAQCTADDLHQICFNLVENAIKYNRPGGSVTVTATPEGDEIIIEVTDTGVGIPEEDISKVFNRFYRVDKARSRAAGGTGLGLSIVRDTVRRHGGWVTASPAGIQGTVFTVGIPRHQQEVSHD